MFSFCRMVCLSVNKITQNVVDLWINVHEIFGGKGSIGFWW